MKTSSEHITWNLVTRRLHGHPLLRTRLRQKITKLEAHLKPFPTDALHLHIALERHPNKPLHRASLSLRVPSHVLHVERSHRDLIKAFDDAVRRLLRELGAMKRHQRGEADWKRRARRQALHAAKVSRFSPEPQPDGIGPQSVQDVLRSLVERHYAGLLRYVRRQLWHDISAGELPQGTIDARGVVDEAVARAMSAPEHKPAKLNFALWLYGIVRDELARRRRAWREQEEHMVSLDLMQPVVDEGDEADGYDAEQPLDIIERDFAPRVTDLEESTPDPGAPTPADAAASRDLLAELRRVVSRWPQPDRDVFELHFVEGFDVDDIALVTKTSKTKAATRLGALQQRLRDAVREQALV